MEMWSFVVALTLFLFGVVFTVVTLILEFKRAQNPDELDPDQPIVVS